MYGWNHWKGILEKFPEFTKETLSLENYTWAFRIIGTRSFGKFMPYVTLFPVGELLNHDNVETYYIYQYPHEKPDASSRYSGIVDENDHDDELITSDKILNLNSQLVLNLNEELSGNSKDLEKIASLRKICAEIDDAEENEAKEHKKYRPPDMDLTENDEKVASICTGPNEHYLPGSEVYMSYGRYSNRQLLSTYGFALKENYFNYAYVKIMLKELAGNDQQLEFFSKTEAFCRFKLKKKVISKVFLRTIRGLYWKNEYPTTSFLNPELPELEIQVLSKAISILQQVLLTYPTTLEEDLNILNNTIPLRRYFAVLYRSQVKDIIKFQIQYLDICKNIIQSISQGVYTAQTINIEEYIGSILESHNTNDTYHCSDPKKLAEGVSEYFNEYKITN